MLYLEFQPLQQALLYIRWRLCTQGLPALYGWRCFDIIAKNIPLTQA